MASKPTKLGEWASDADRTLEPSAGEKGTGWQAGYKPPARKMNWLFNIAYQWFQYLSDAVLVADTGSGDDGIDATGDGAGAGGDFHAGATNAIGVKGTGTGTGEGVYGVAAGASPAAATGSGVYGAAGAVTSAGVRGDGITGGTGVAQGVGVRGNGATDGAGVYGSGGASDGPGVYGAGGATNGRGVEGLGAGTGAGVYGSSAGAGTGVHGASTTGWGVRAQGDTSGAIAKAALHIDPQYTATAPAADDVGDVYDHAASGGNYAKLRHFNGGEWERLVPQVHAIVADESESASSGLNDFETSKYTIPAGSLVAGSTIRVRAAGNITAQSGFDSVNIVLDDGTSELKVKSGDSGTTGAFWAEAVATVRSIGATGAVRLAGLANVPAAPRVTSADRASGTLDTTAAIDVRVELEDAGGTFSATLEQFIVDVT